MRTTVVPDHPRTGQRIDPRAASTTGLVTTSSAAVSTSWSSVVSSARARVTSWSRASRRRPFSMRESVEGLRLARAARSSRDQPCATRSARRRWRTRPSTSPSSCVMGKILCRVSKTGLASEQSARQRRIDDHHRHHHHPRRRRHRRRRRRTERRAHARPVPPFRRRRRRRRAAQRPRRGRPRAARAGRRRPRRAVPARPRGGPALRRPGGHRHRGRRGAAAGLPGRRPALRGHALRRDHPHRAAPARRDRRARPAAGRPRARAALGRRRRALPLLPRLGGARRADRHPRRRPGLQSPGAPVPPAHRRRRLLHPRHRARRRGPGAAVRPGRAHRRHPGGGGRHRAGRRDRRRAAHRWRGRRPPGARRRDHAPAPAGGAGGARAAGGGPAGRGGAPGGVRHGRHHTGRGRAGGRQRHRADGPGGRLGRRRGTGRGAHERPPRGRGGGRRAAHVRPGRGRQELSEAARVTRTGPCGVIPPGVSLSPIGERAPHLPGSPTDREDPMTSPTRPHSADVDAVQRRTVVTMTLAQVFSALGNGSTLALGSILAVDISGSEGLAGVTTTAMTLAPALTAVPLAGLAVRRGRRVALTAGLVGATVGTLLIVAATLWRAFPLLVLGAFLVGLGSAVNLQARFAATDLARPERRGRDLSLVVWAVTIGAVAGPNMVAPGAALSAALGLPAEAGAFLISGAGMALGAALLLVGLRPDPLLLRQQLDAQGATTGTALPAGRAAVARPSVRAGWDAIRTSTPAKAALAMLLAAHAVMVSVMAMTPLHLQHTAGDGAHHPDFLTVVGLTISLHVAGMYALSPLMGWAADRFGGSRVALAGLAVLLAAVAVAGLGDR